MILDSGLIFGPPCIIKMKMMLTSTWQLLLAR